MKSLIRMSCLVAVLVLSRASAADQKPALIGATRDDVLSRLGTPSGDIVAGDREVLVFSTQRVVLSAGRVVEVEEIAGEAASPATATTASTDSTTQPAPSVADSSSATAAPAVSAAQSTGEGSQAAAGAPASAPSESQVVIKSVRPPSAFFRPTPSAANAPAPRTAPADQPSYPATTAAPVSPAAITAPAVTASASPTATGSGAATPALATQGAATPTPFVAGSTATTPPPAVVAPAATQPAKPAAPSKPRPAAVDAAAAAPTTASAGFLSSRTNLIALAFIVGAIAYLVWRRRNRQLMLAATAVANSPILAQPTYGNGARFTQDLLGKLEWKRFEELVAAYYNKTGVMATRTKSGPAAPVHIRISWKGEQRPFALVQCIAQPAGLVDAKPVQALCDVLAAEDIRRGYLVTSGKFGIGARDLAEEKHVTLLSGDIFLEKLNALPDPVRAELMHEITKVDYTTPTCPKCDLKMVHPPGNPDGWQCPHCGAVLPQA